MSESDITAIISELASLRTEVLGMRGMLSDIRAGGCSRAASHSEIQRDQELRLREMERWQNEQRGKMVGVSGVVSIAVTAAGLLLSWLVSK